MWLEHCSILIDEELVKLCFNSISSSFHSQLLAGSVEDLVKLLWPGGVTQIDTRAIDLPGLPLSCSPERIHEKVTSRKLKIDTN